MVMLDSTVVNVTVSAAGVEVERQHPAGTRGGIIDGDRGRLVWRIRGQPPGMPRGISAAAVA